MIQFDVNVLIYATDAAAADHLRYRSWLDGVILGSSAFAVSDLVLSSFLRIVTNPRIFNTPSSLSTALAIVEGIRARPNCVVVQPGPRHWEIFVDLCRRVNAKGNLIPDAYFASLAIESGSEWYTTDRDYARFPGLRWRHPLDDDARG
jgi:toxin-antitoxin system PIN domain toxin